MQIAKNQRWADSHYNLSGYANQGIPLRQLQDYMKRCGVERLGLMPMPVQQKWDPLEEWAGGTRPNTWASVNADMTFYSGCDAMLASAVSRLSAEEQQYFDPMIAGFNPMDRNNSVDHIQRTLLDFPGVFSGLGEISVHKECVSKKIAGRPLAEVITSDAPPDSYDGKEKVTLYSPALAETLVFAGQVGLPVNLHCDSYYSDISAVGEVRSVRPDWTYIEGLKWLGSQAPQTQVIWAHCGLGRFINPTKDHVKWVSDLLESNSNWSVDISWSYIQKCMVNNAPSMPQLEEWADFCMTYQDRVLWGSDVNGHSKNWLDQGVLKLGTPLSFEDYSSVMQILEPLFALLDEEVGNKIRFENHCRIYDAGRKSARAWERAHAGEHSF
jgi:hypothetical protein